MEPEDVTELLQSHDKTLTDEESLLMVEERKWFLEMESTPGEEDWWNDTKDLEYCIPLVDKAVAGFDRTDSNSERRSTLGKMLSNSTTCYRETVHERKSQFIWQTSCCLIFKKFPQPPQPSVTTTLISQLPSISRQDRPPAKGLPLAKGSGDG